MSVGTRSISTGCREQWLRIPAEHLGLRTMGLGLLPSYTHPTQESLRLDGGGAWHGVSVSASRSSPRPAFSPSGRVK